MLMYFISSRGLQPEAPFFLVQKNQNIKWHFKYRQAEVFIFGLSYTSSKLYTASEIV